jgi:hypothetical protein
MRQSAVLVVFTAIAVAACGSKGPQPAPAAKPGEGIVFFSVSHDREAGVGARLLVFLDDSPLPTRAASLPMSADVLKEMSGAIYIAMFGRIGDLDDGYGQLHVVTLPAGQHRLRHWAITHGMTTTLPAGASPPLEFTVQAGRTVYLGNLHGRVRLGRDWFNQQVVLHAYPEVRDLAERDLQILRKKHPSFDEQVDIALLTQGPWGDPARVNTRTNQPVYGPMPVK